MSCDVARTSQALCSGTGSGRSACSSLGPGRAPYIIAISKMNISNMTRKDPTRSTFTDSMDQMPTCGLLKSSVAICACLFGNMFIGKNKNPFSGNGSKEMKALEYFQNYAIPMRTNLGGKKEQSDKGTERDATMRRSSLQDRNALIERAEKKMQQLAMLYRDSWDMYRMLMSENLDNSPYKDKVRKIQILLSRVTKFLTFAHGKLDTLKTYTLLELIEILEELEYFLKLTSDMQRGKDVSQASLEYGKQSESHDSSKTKQKGIDNEQEYKENQSCSLKALGKGDAENNKALPHYGVSKEGEGLSNYASDMSAPRDDQGDPSQRNTLPNHRPGSVYISKVAPPEKDQKLDEPNISLSMERLGCGDIVKDSDRLNSRVTITSFRCKQRSVYAGMKHPISQFDATINIENRVKSTISHINAMGQVQAKIDKTRLEKIFGKIGRIVGETNIKKPTKTKLEQISREFVKIKDTIVRLMKINKSAKGMSDAGGKGDVNIENMGGDNLVNLEGYQKGMTEYENKLDQLNKKLEEVRTAYDLLRTISINALSHHNKKNEVKRLMTDLNLITLELNKIQPSFTLTDMETTVLTVQTTNTFGDTESEKASTSENCGSEQGKSHNVNQDTSTKKVSIAVDTSETAGMKWPNPRYQSVLYNFDSDEQSQTQVQNGNAKKDNGEGQEDLKPLETTVPGEKGTQTRLDTISSWIEKHKAGEVVYEDSCIVTIGQPVRRTRSVNIINQESRKLATQKLQCQSSESIIAPTKSKQSDNCRNRFKELLKVGRGFFERSCKKNMEKAEAITSQVQEISDSDKPLTPGCSLGVEKDSDPSKKSSSCCNKNNSDKTTKESGLSKCKLTMKHIQTSYDDFVVKPELLYIDKVPNGRSNYTCQEQDVRVKEAVENALAGIESAYSVALREFISILNTQGISVKMDASSKSTSTTTLKPPSSRQSVTSFTNETNGNSSHKQVQFVSTISVDSILLKSSSGGNKTDKRVPLPSSRSRIVQHIATGNSSLHRDRLVEYINTFDNSSLLLIQNNNFK